jgi:phosphoribosyl 1,2-cyclic phosphodiesterase
MLRFISFGSGSSGNCYYLYTETDSLIIDAGVGIRTLKKYFRDYGLSIYKVHRILITHDHADHIKCVGSMSHDFQLPVFATPIVHQGIDRNYCVARKVSSELRQYLEPGVTVQLGEFSVTPFTVPHDSSDNVGYLIEAQDTTFCLITDAGRVTDEMAGYINRAHYLVIEANHDREMLQQGPYPQYLKDRIVSGTGHLSNEACGQAIATNMSEQLKQVWLCHLSEENNHPELARKTVESVLRSYGIISGCDIKLEVLKRTMPTGIFDLGASVK